MAAPNTFFRDENFSSRYEISSSYWTLIFTEFSSASLQTVVNDIISNRLVPNHNLHDPLIQAKVSDYLSMYTYKLGRGIPLCSHNKRIKYLAVYHKRFGHNF
jgi:hypothetical protein